MISTDTKVREFKSPAKREAQELLTACLLESGFKVGRSELLRGRTESLVFADDFVQHNKNYAPVVTLSRGLPFYEQAMILIASGAIDQNLSSKFKL